MFVWTRDIAVIFLEQPLTDDPQAHLLLQIQGAVAEYERTKIAERYRRGKLYRARQGEVVAWRVPYGYRRVPRSSGSPARLEIFEPEAAMVRQIFTWHVEEHLSVRELAKRLTLEQVPTPQGRSRYWGTSTLSRILHNQAYIGAWQTNTAQMTRLTGPKIHVRWQTVPRDRQEWITIPVPPIVDTDLFQRSQQIHRDNSRFSPRHLGRPWWLLRCLVWCGECHHSCRCHTMRTRNGTLTRYYHCQSHTSFVSPEQRCGQRHIRADALDAFVWRKVSEVLRDPQVLLQAIAGGGQFLSDDDALTNQLDVVKRQCGQVQKEQQRLLDAYQVELLTLDQLEKRMLPLRARAEALEQEIERLETEQGEARSTRNFRDNVQALCATVSAGLSNLSFYERQEFMRLMVERVEVENWNVQIVFRIPLPGDDSLSTTPSSR
ncbi:MAG: recombinase family protein, partial [Chloroflexota bacterium]